MVGAENPNQVTAAKDESLTFSDQKAYYATRFEKRMWLHSLNCVLRELKFAATWFGY